jgi:hypothetical protein
MEILVAQAASRVPELFPIRYGRMLVSPFTFYRGAAAVMAADLATTPDSGTPCRPAATKGTSFDQAIVRFATAYAAKTSAITGALRTPSPQPRWPPSQASEPSPGLAQSTQTTQPMAARNLSR